MQYPDNLASRPGMTRQCGYLTVGRNLASGNLLDDPYRTLMEGGNHGLLGYASVSFLDMGGWPTRLRRAVGIMAHGAVGQGPSVLTLSDAVATQKR